MLMGEHFCMLDDKGRLNFPAKLRSEMGESFVVTQWMDNCLMAVSMQDWRELRQQMQANTSTADGRKTRRMMVAKAVEVTPDRQGRILIPPGQRAYAGLTKEVAVVGQDRYAEIWDAARWRGMDEALDGEVIAEAMTRINF
jgi:MraZ protein